jgi:nitrite reductase (NO-forming)
MNADTKIWAVLAGVLAACALLVATAALARGDDSEGSAEGSMAAQAPSGAPQVRAMDVELGDLFIKPSSLDVASNTTLKLTVKNTGVIPHDLKLGDSGTGMLNPGESETVTFGPIDHDVKLVCDVPGHSAAGMTLDVKVTGAGTATTHAASSGSTTQGAKIDPRATPSAGWKPRDAMLPAAEGGALHRMTLEATETRIEVAPGVTQELWTFNNEVPGPVLRGKVGDVFEVTLVNKGKLGHSIDFHASKVAWNDEMRTIQPGESLVYRFEAKSAGIFMYHCGTAPALHHIGNGMFGAIIIDPPNLPPVDREFLFVQSEYYLGPEGQPGDLTKMQQEQWDAVVFNGYVNQYQHAPIRIEPNRRYRVWVLDAGPSENSSFHIVGTIFDTVYKEGSYLLRTDENRGGSQALGLQPAQGGFVEFTMDEAGLYPAVTHKFANVGKGALGIFQAGEVAATGAGH